MLEGAEQQHPQPGSFFSGLSNREGTKPGFRLDNETFSVTFEAIQCENVASAQRNFVIDRFESCYDWSEVMNIILVCLEYFYDEGGFQIDTQHSISAWLREFSGWGLLFTLLPMDFQKFLLVLYSHLNVKNSQENVVKSNEELYEDLIDMYENETQGLPLHDLVPKVQTRLVNFVGGHGECERKKVLKVVFNSSRFQLIANFRVEKKRVRRSLVEHCAEVVGSIVDDAEDLEIPETLKPVISEKIIDADWVASYWYAKHKLDEMRRKFKEEKRMMMEAESKRTAKMPLGMTLLSYVVWSFRHSISSIFRNFITRNNS